MFSNLIRINKTSVIINKIALLGFVVISILSTAASCDTQTKQPEATKTTQTSSSVSNSSLSSISNSSKVSQKLSSSSLLSSLSSKSSYSSIKSTSTKSVSQNNPSSVTTTNSNKIESPKSIIVSSVGITYQPQPIQTIIEPTVAEIITESKNNIATPAFVDPTYIEQKTVEQKPKLVEPIIATNVPVSKPLQSNEINYNRQNPIQNVCKDGSLSHSTGRGTCSGHGGIKR